MLEFKTTVSLLILCSAGIDYFTFNFTKKKTYFKLLHNNGNYFNVFY